ncbi:uncharacterized protein BKA55DRAFT_694646 [Fusarium redolens]|uniref:Uncharacterized protein n=1 Tax=Fusarium redolens TaxID=48865 RepID=A0A9P9GFG9_FUSRE|nr:uncharacterized protein BKA55DRAFT_694646 [Fusarium redolens]KAH7237024.1 hypothetical protein BKA55DRAFT_694646 [Fusarium redolens]
MADVYYALNGGGLTGSPLDPAITELPWLDKNDVLKRQNPGTYDSGSRITAIIPAFQRRPVQPATVTLDVKDTSERGALLHRLAPQHLQTSYVAGCFTAVSTDSDSDEFTLYPFCTTADIEVTMYKALKGVSATAETSSESSSETVSSDGGLTAKTGTTGESRTQETTSSAESGSSSGADSSSNSSAPIGAIVGGVLGGLALLALIGFGLWFIRHKKRQAAHGPHVVPTTDQPPVVPYYQQQPVTHAQGEANYQPLVSGMSSEPKAYSPSANMRNSTFNELQSFHNESPNPTGYR